MREFIKNMKISFILASVLYIVLGVVLLIWPDTTKDVLCFAIGAVLLVYGIITIISFFVHDSKSGVFRFELVFGIISAGVGILFLVKPEIVSSIIPIVLGIYIIIDALLNVKRALDLKGMGYERWLVPLVLSLVSVALGVFILFRPGFVADFIVMIIGGVLVYNGASDLWSLFMLGRVAKNIEKNGIIQVDPLDIE